MALVSGPGIAGASKDDAQANLQLHKQEHIDYITSLDKRTDELEYWLTEHLRLNGVYWGLTSLFLLGSPNSLPRDATISFVYSCQHGNGGFGAAPGHDPHMLYTVSAIQILAMVDALDTLNERGHGGRSAVVSFIAGLQDPATGAFKGDEWGEIDVRFLYGAFNALSLLGRLYDVDVDQAVAWVQACGNSDGAYGAVPGAESHAGQVFTCVGALAIARRLDLVDQERLGQWLSERQLGNGGLNGRPEKLEDVCYSWWVVSSLAMIRRLHWIDHAQLQAFILSCQDTTHGGFADRPGDAVDVYHTCFALAGLSLLGCHDLKPVDPVYCMPLNLLNRMREDSTLTALAPYHA